MTVSLVLTLISVVLILDSMFVLLFPKTTRNLLKILMKKNNLKKIAIWELIIGIIILLISFLL